MQPPAKAWLARRRGLPRRSSAQFNRVETTPQARLAVGVGLIGTIRSGSLNGGATAVAAGTRLTTLQPARQGLAAVGVTDRFARPRPLQGTGFELGPQLAEQLEMPCGVVAPKHGWIPGHRCSDSRVAVNSPT
jgi:hypothetical protein